MSGSKFLWLSASLCCAGEPAAPLSQAEMQQALRTLQTEFAQKEAVNFASLNRIAIDGLLRANPQTMQLITLPDGPAAEAPPPLEEALTPGITCLRPQAFRTSDLAACKAVLTKLTSSGTGALILDLRAPADDGDPPAAAAFAALFLPRGTPLFSFPAPLKTESDPVWTRDLAVLIDGDSCNVAEILACVLQIHRRAVLTGSVTRGRTASIASLVLRKDPAGTLVLRYTAQPVAFSAGTDPLAKGIVPDLPVQVESSDKRALFAFQAKEGLARTVFQTPPPRTNEASLVARTNPELPGRIARTMEKPGAARALPVDRPLQLAADMLVARQVIDPVKK